MLAAAPTDVKRTAGERQLDGRIPNRTTLRAMWEMVLELFEICGGFDASFTQAARLHLCSCAVISSFMCSWKETRRFHQGMRWTERSLNTGSGILGAYGGGALFVACCGKLPNCDSCPNNFSSRLNP